MNRENLATELLRLERNGLISPVEAVRWARAHPSSDLHASLEWDDAVAGEAYRVQQVRQLITVFVEPTHNVRQYVSLSVDRVQGGGYRRIEQVMNEASLRAVLLEDALRDFERAQAKYSMLQELDRVWAVVDDVRKGPPAKKQAGGTAARKSGRKAPRKR